MLVASNALQGNFQAATHQLGELQKTSTDPRIPYLAPLFQAALHWRRMLLVGGGLSGGDARLLAREFGPPATELLDTAGRAAQSLGPSHYDEILAAVRQYYWLQTCVDQLPVLNVALSDGTVLALSRDTSKEQKQSTRREHFANRCAQAEEGGVTDATRELLTSFVAARLALILRQDSQAAREHYGRGLELVQRNGWQRAAGHWLLHLGDLAAAPYGDVLSFGYILVEDLGRSYASILANSSLALDAQWGITPPALNDAEYWYAEAQAAAATTEEPLAPSLFTMRKAYLAFRRGEPSAALLYEEAARDAGKDGSVLIEIMARASLALLRGEQAPFAKAFDVASRQQYPGAMLSMVELAKSHAMRLRARGEGFAAATSLAIPAATLPAQGWEGARADLLWDLSGIESALGRQEASVRRKDDAIASRKLHIDRLVEAAQRPRANLPDILESITPIYIENQKHRIVVETYDLLSSLQNLSIAEALAQWNERVRQVETLLPRNQDFEQLLAKHQPDNERAYKSLRVWRGQEDCARVLRSFAQQDAMRPPNKKPRALVQSLVMASECDPLLLRRAQAVLEHLDPVSPVAAALRQFRQEMSFPALLELQNALGDLNGFFLLARVAEASSVMARWAHEEAKLAQSDALLAGLALVAELQKAQAFLIDGEAAQAHSLLDAILTTEFLQSPTAFRELRMDVLSALVDVYVQLDRPEEALLAVERLRAEQDWWQTVITRVREEDPQSAEMALLEREAALSGSGSSQRLIALERRALTSQAPPRTLPTLDALRAALKAAPLDTVVLAYHPVREHLVIWRVEHGQPLRMMRVRVPAGSQWLSRLLVRFKRQLSENEPAWQASSAELFHILIEPAGPLPAGHTLAIAGADTLGSIPFEALGAASTRLLIQDHPVVYVSSLIARASDAKRPSGAGQRVVVAGFNGRSLRHAEQEARDVARLYGSSPIYGSKATVDQITARLPAARLVHLSTHGVMDNANPYRSYLLLKDDRLTVWRLFRNTAQAELVVLSACDTKQAQSSLDPVGRMRDFQSVTALIARGGARRVVSSLWKANDNAGRRVMVAFHRTLARELANPARALQQAKLTLAASPDHQPQLWANYTLSVRDPAAIRIDAP